MFTVEYQKEKKEEGQSTNASLHHWYGGSPSRGTPGDAVPVRFNFSSRVNAAINAFTRSAVVAAGLQTVLFLRGPLTQSGNAAWAVLHKAERANNVNFILRDATFQRVYKSSSANSCLLKNRGISSRCTRWLWSILTPRRRIKYSAVPIPKNQSNTHHFSGGRAFHCWSYMTLSTAIDDRMHCRSIAG